MILRRSFSLHFMIFRLTVEAQFSPNNDMSRTGEKMLIAKVVLLADDFGDDEWF